MALGHAAAYCAGRLAYSAWFVWRPGPLRGPRLLLCAKMCRSGTGDYEVATSWSSPYSPNVLEGGFSNVRTSFRQMASRLAVERVSLLRLKREVTRRCDPLPQQPRETPVPDGGAKPFRVALPESLLADLRERLDRTRWPDEIPGSGWGYGTNLLYARELAAYWKDEYDWRVQEAKLNAFEQYSAPLKGIDLHFIHERGDGDDPVPILLLHGWPSSVWEFHKIIHLLTDAGERGGFSVVVPSLPGYGFSFRPFQDRFGLVECADALSELMTGALSYEEYVIAGGDWGAHIATRMAYAHPDAVLGLHLNMLPLRLAGAPLGGRVGLLARAWRMAARGNRVLAAAGHAPADSGLRADRLTDWSRRLDRREVRPVE